jgi:SAM-dependent methyltransferase
MGTPWDRFPNQSSIKSFKAVCPICRETKSFAAQDDFWHGRDGLLTETCPYDGCWTRERALAFVIKSIYPENQLRGLKIHESSPAQRGLSRWFKAHCKHYLQTGFFPDAPTGAIIEGLRNENLERQSFADGIFDLVIHLDVMEHLFEPFLALREIHRTLKPGGRTIFAAPTSWNTFYSEQVAFHTETGIEIIGEPEYHGNPQDEAGALVTWRYGYDFPVLISRETEFDTEVRRFQSREAAAIGAMNEVYVLTKQT